MPANANFTPYYDTERQRWVYPMHLLSGGISSSPYGEYNLLRHLEGMAERFPDDYGIGTTIWNTGGQDISGYGYKEELEPLGRFSNDANNIAKFEWYSQYRDDDSTDPEDPGDSFEGDPPVSPGEGMEPGSSPDVPGPVTSTNKPRTKSKTFHPTEDYENTIRMGANAPQRPNNKL